MVVLHHLLGNAEVGEHLTPIGLAEEPPLVAKDPWLDQNRPVEPSLETLFVARTGRKLD